MITGTQGPLMAYYNDALNSLFVRVAPAGTGRGRITDPCDGGASGRFVQRHVAFSAPAAAPAGTRSSPPTRQALSRG